MEIINKYVRLCGYDSDGRPKKQGQNDPVKLSLAEIANQFNMSEKSLKRVLAIERNLSEPMKELLDNGVISKTVAADVIASLSEQEQEELLSSMDVTKKNTGKAIQDLIRQLKEKGEQNRL